MNKDYSLDQISSIAKELIQHVPNKVLLFYGAMGSGKTTLIKEIAKQLGVQEVASSPTFSLVNEYISDKGEIIYHFDFYRINSEEEAYDIGVEEYLYSNSWCFIEWPNKVENLLPLESVAIHISILSNGLRNIQIT
jgi:tRNA threonylcarbamoyladenosine biosynthesis protein TsaE